MAGKEIAVKKYVVRLSADERERLEVLTHAGKSPAQLLTKARILLKADVAEAGEGWSDSAISAALGASVNNIGRLVRATATAETAPCRHAGRGRACASIPKSYQVGPRRHALP